MARMPRVGQNRGCSATAVFDVGESPCRFLKQLERAGIALFQVRWNNKNRQLCALGRLLTIKTIRILTIDGWSDLIRCWGLGFAFIVGEGESDDWRGVSVC